MDFSIQTDHVIEAQRLDLVVVDKIRRICKITYFSVLRVSRTEKKEKEKIEKYQDLRRELQKIWNVRGNIIPLVVGYLGNISKQFGKRLRETGTTAEIGKVYETISSGATRILRTVFQIYGCCLWLDFEKIFHYSFTVF